MQFVIFSLVEQLKGNDMAEKKVAKPRKTRPKKKSLAERGPYKPFAEYKEEYAELAYKLSLLGLVDVQIAEFFGCAKSTLNNWKKDHPEFFEAIKKGKLPVDAEVANSLLKRSMGFYYEDEVITKNGPVTVTKYCIPDTTACLAWLNNRQPEYWRQRKDKPEAIDKNNEDVKIIIEVEDASKES